MPVGEWVSAGKKEESLRGGNWQLAIPFPRLIELVSGSLSLSASLYLSLCLSPYLSLFLLTPGWCSREWGITNPQSVSQSIP